MKCGRVFHDLCDLIEVINGTFTFQFVLLFANILVSEYAKFDIYLLKYSSQVSFVFSAYDIIDELVRVTQFSYVNCFLDSFTIMKHLTLILITVAAGSRLAKEAQKTPTVISKILVGSELSVENDSEFNKLTGLIAQMRGRDWSIHNDMFVINWNILLAASFDN
jgi:hypothetical protein